MILPDNLSNNLETEVDTLLAPATPSNQKVYLEKVTTFYEKYAGYKYKGANKCHDNVIDHYRDAKRVFKLI
jgi:hypothetical protein